MIDLQITSENPGWDTDLPDYESVVERAIHAVFATCPVAGEIKDSVPSIEISITLSDDESVRVLNRDYRGKDKPTNVLSFAMQDSEDGWEYPTPGIPCTLGDLVIARETVAREAADETKSFADHFTHLVVHGTLHLLGYDHIDDDEANEMEGLEINILNGLGIKNPYLLPDGD